MKSDPAGQEPGASCPACGSGQFDRQSVMPGVAVKRCVACGLLLSTIVARSDTTPEFSRVNQARYARGLLATRDRQSDELIAIAREHVPEARDLVDVGCSYGRFLARARAAGFRVRGVEPDPLAAASARALLGDDAVRDGVLTRDLFPPASADIVTTLDVLEHIPVQDMAAFLSTIRSLLRPGGAWIVKVPSSEGPFFQVAHRLRRLAPALVRGVLERLWQSRYEYPHTVYFNAPALRALATRHGFAVERVTYLEELPSGTILDRLRHDDSVSLFSAIALAPALLVINLTGRLLGRTDAMVMVARLGEEPPAPARA